MIDLTPEEIDKLLTYVESMIELCDSQEESEFYINLLEKLGGRL